MKSHSDEILFTKRTKLINEKERHVQIQIRRFRRVDSNKIALGDWTYYCGFEKGEIYESYGPSASQNLSEKADEVVLAKLCEAQQHLKSGEEARIVEIITSVQTNQLAPDDDVMQERLRHSALSKLTQAERTALGLEAIAVYDKVKFHG